MSMGGGTEHDIVVEQIPVVCVYAHHLPARRYFVVGYYEPLSLLPASSVLVYSLARVKEEHHMRNEKTWMSSIFCVVMFFEARVRCDVFRGTSSKIAVGTVAISALGNDNEYEWMSYFCIKTSSHYRYRCRRCSARCCSNPKKMESCFLGSFFPCTHTSAVITGPNFLGQAQQHTYEFAPLSTFWNFALVWNTPGLPL